MDTLAAISSLTTPKDHIEAILDGLSDASVISHLDPCTVDDIEALLLA